MIPGETLTAPSSTPTGAPEKGAPVVRVRDLSVHYANAREATVHCEYLDVHPGERIAVVGTSGSGKTTLLRAIEGSIKYTGDITREGVAVLIYQDLRLVHERTVIDNVCAGALGRMNGAGGIVRFDSKLKKRAERLLRDLGLAKLSHAHVGSLSGGQRQRVAIARALCAEPAVLLADEPTASLDPANSRRVLTLLMHLQKKYGFALVVSSHAVAADISRFDRVLAVRKNRVEQLEVETSKAARIAVDCPVTRAIDAVHDEAPDEDQDNRPAERSKLAQGARAGLALMAVGAVLAWSASALNLDQRAFTGALGGMVDFLRNIFPSSWAEWKALPWASLGRSLIVTIQMAIVGTVIGIIVSLPLSVLASRVTGPRFIRWPVRQLLNLVRTIPSIFWALIFVAAVGLGPVAGVFALAMYSVGYLTKFFYEGLENADDRPGRALEAMGASRLQVFFHAILPAAKPTLLAACLFVLEYNIRSASVLGVVGAGGIGQDLMYYIEWREFPKAAAGLAMILGVVILLDSVSETWRRKLVKARGT